MGSVRPSQVRDVGFKLELDKIGAGDMVWLRGWRAGELAQKLKAMATLPKDLDSIPSTHKAAHTVCNSTFRGSDFHTDIYAGKTLMYIKLSHL